MEYNPFLPDVQANPYPYYAELRRDAPVYQVPGVGFWAVSRYDDVFSLLRNPQVFSSAGFMDALLGEFNPFLPEAPAIIAYDPPDHTRLRKLANRAFTPRRVASLETHVREVAHQLIERIPTQGEFDLVKDLSSPLPVIVIAELLGVEPERRHDFRTWADDLVRASSGAIITQEDRERTHQSIANFHAYFRAAIARYREKPGDNLISDLVRAEEEEQRLNAEEVVSLALFLLFAGNETTTNLIGNTMLALLNQPEELAKVRANPALIPNLLEEVLRYDGPIQLLIRQAKQDIALAGTTIPAGAIVLPLLGSANHDERKFPDPDRLDMTRNAEGHVGFGFGVHFCLGAQLARLEAKLALESLLRRFPRLSRTDEQFTRIESIMARGPKTLPLMAR